MGIPPQNTENGALFCQESGQSAPYFLFLTSYFLPENYFLSKKSLPAEPFQNKRIRNPAAARTVPSRMVCATSVLSWRRRGMRLTAMEGGLHTPHPKPGLLFTLCGFLRSSLSRFPQAGIE